jgi:hypothetical protein
MGGGFEIRCLQDVVGVNASLQALVQAESDHAAQPVLMPCQECRPGLLVTLRGPLDL